MTCAPQHSRRSPRRARRASPPARRPARAAPAPPQRRPLTMTARRGAARAAGLRRGPGEGSRRGLPAVVPGVGGRRRAATAAAVARARAGGPRAPGRQRVHVLEGVQDRVALRVAHAQLLQRGLRGREHLRAMAGALTPGRACEWARAPGRDTARRPQRRPQSAYLDRASPGLTAKQLIKQATV